MKHHVTAKIVDITEWSRDDWEIEGAASHEGYSRVMQEVAEEVREKLENFTHEPLGLPFEYEFDIVPDYSALLTDDEIKDRMLEEYTEQFYPFSYVKPTDCELEITRFEHHVEE